MRRVLPEATHCKDIADTDGDPYVSAQRSYRAACNDLKAVSSASDGRRSIAELIDDLNRFCVSGVWRCMDRCCPELLFELARKCLQASPSRALDGRIYCALHGMTDANDLSAARDIEARANGEVLLLGSHGLSWMTAPRFTRNLDCARSLLPPGLLTISRDPMIVCSTALAALAIRTGTVRDLRRPERAR